MSSTNGDESAAPCFVDTNVFVYALAPADPKCDRAKELIKQLMENRALRSSTQVLQELYVTATRKIQRPITPAQALEYISRLTDWPVVVNDFGVIREAAELAASSMPISFWDALIVVAAKRARAVRIYTEDLQHGQRILGIEIVNPFAAASR